MDTSELSDRRRDAAGGRDAGFSLVEITLAVGIVAFGFLAVFGLIPTGLNVMRQAVDTTVGSAIIQRIMNDAQQTDFATLVKADSGGAVPATVRYFDDQGTEVAAIGASGSLYQARTLITPTTTLPGSSSMNNLATVTIQIVNDPAHRALNVDGSTQLWKDSRVAITTYSGFVSQASGYVPPK